MTKKITAIFLEKGSHKDKVNTEYFEMSYCIL